MAEKVCPRLEPCIFFNNRMSNMPATAEIIKQALCRGGNHEECARFRVAAGIGAENVPADLYPRDVEKMETILASIQVR